MSNYYMSDHTPVGGGGISPKGNGYSHSNNPGKGSVLGQEMRI